MVSKISLFPKRIVHLSSQLLGEVLFRPLVSFIIEFTFSKLAPSSYFGNSSSNTSGRYQIRIGGSKPNRKAEECKSWEVVFICLVK